MRGKQTVSRFAGVRSRIIPAHAGQTCTPRTSCDFPQDHPRACGANACMTGVIDNVDGSSPRMRGKPTRPLAHFLPPRIIPAHAGQTRPPQRVAHVVADHPRACGANSKRISAKYSHTGSSPRMRGKHRRLVTSFGFAGIIPAHAGQTVRFYAKTLERWTLNNWIRTVAPIFVLLFLPPVIGQNAYIERHYSNQSFSWFSKLHYASAFDLSLVA